MDTNILVYAIDASPGENQKREIARKTLKRHIRDENGVISIQVLQEFYQTATHKIQTFLSTQDAIEFMHHVSILEIVQPDFHLVLAAIHLHRQYALSFWDALILQSAMVAGCSQLFTEDMQDGFCLEELTVTNPFKAPL
ncbi:MAG: PIN domain-containing protein [Desulfohalobiaceae bacterium]|nr:PIN domain-containing protein [Desulfohalobiaceae bacterium]